MDPHEHHLTVTTFNVMFDVAARPRRARMTAAAMLQSRPDLVLLQELPFEQWTVEHGQDSSEYLNTLVESTGLQVGFATPLDAFDFRDGNRIATTCAILHSGKLVLRESGELPMHPDLVGFTPYVQGSWAVFDDPTGRAVAAVNLHGAWGGHNVALREKQILNADRFAAELENRLKDEGRDPVIVLGGDLNAEAESTPIRFLTGLAPIQGRGTYWVDAWAAAGDGGPGFTSVSDNYWFQRTALRVGIDDPHAVPDRRIDYLFVRGWAYGRRGNPVRAWVDVTDTDEIGRHASDHLGLSAVLHPGAQALHEARRAAGPARIRTRSPLPSSPGSP